MFEIPDVDLVSGVDFVVTAPARFSPRIIIVAQRSLEEPRLCVFLPQERRDAGPRRF
jgi:hypothetical protein